MDSYGVALRHKSANLIMQGKRRMNLMGIVLSLYLPWLVFCVVFAARSFETRVVSPTRSWIVVGIAFVFVALIANLAYELVRKNARGEDNQQPMWYVFIAVTSALAWATALYLGEWNWSENMSIFFTMSNLNMHTGVDPATMPGQQVMDAGSIVFTNGTFVNTKLAMGFRNEHVYCVAPITSVSDPIAQYDFWAVGINCCDGSAGDFKCGDYDNRRAHSGLRWMKDDQRSFFRLAVQQAEATHSIRAVHPLFFSFVEDAMDMKLLIKKNAWRFFTIGMYVSFLVQLVFVFCAVTVYNKFGTK